VERRYSSYSFSTSAVDESEWSALRPGRALPPRKGPPVPLMQEAWWAPEPVWTQRLQDKYFRFCRGTNLGRPFFQPIARHYTDWATPAHFVRCPTTYFPSSTLTIYKVIQEAHTNVASFFGTGISSAARRNKMKYLLFLNIFADSLFSLLPLKSKVTIVRPPFCLSACLSFLW
jgi:hypothetical protein